MFPVFWTKSFRTVPRKHLEAQGEVGRELPSAVKAGSCWAGSEGLQCGRRRAEPLQGLQEACGSPIVGQEGLRLAR